MRSKVKADQTQEWMTSDGRRPSNSKKEYTKSNLVMSLSHQSRRVKVQFMTSKFKELLERVNGFKPSSKWVQRSMMT